MKTVIAYIAAAAHISVSQTAVTLVYIPPSISPPISHWFLLGLHCFGPYSQHDWMLTGPHFGNHVHQWPDWQHPGTFQNQTLQSYPGAGGCVKTLILCLRCCSAFRCGIEEIQTPWSFEWLHHTPQEMFRGHKWHKWIVDGWGKTQKWSLASRICIRQRTEKGRKTFLMLPVYWTFCCYSGSIDHKAAVKMC